MKRLFFALLFLVSPVFSQIPGYSVPTSGVGLTVCIGPGSNTLTGSLVTYPGSCLAMAKNVTNFGYLDSATGVLVVNSTGAPVSSCPVFEADTDFFQVNKVRDKRPSLCDRGGSGTSGPLITKGDIFTFTTVNARQPVGTDGQVLIADSTQSAGLKWSSTSNPLSTLVQSGLLCQFAFTDNSGTTVTDSSGNARNATFPGGSNNPVWIGAPTGGLSFGSTQFLTLPTACTATARTIEIFYSYQASAVQSRQVLYTNGSEFVDFYNNRYYQNTTAGNLGFSNLKIDVAAASPFSMVMNGTFLFTFLTGTTGDATYDAFYRNADFWQWTSPPLAPSFATSRWGDSGGIGNATTLSMNDSSLFFGGNVYYALFYNRRIAQTEIAQNSSVVNSIIAARGVNSLPTSTLPVGNTAAIDNQLVCDGDSITIGYQSGGVSYCDFLFLNGGTWTTGTAALDAQSMQALAQSAATTILPSLTPLAQRSAVAILAGSNDITAYGSTEVLTEDALVNYCTKVRKTGAKCFVGTMISRNNPAGGDTHKNIYGPWVRANWPSFADGLMDFGATPLGADGAAAAGLPLYQGDQTHPTSQADINLMAPVVNHAINAYYGNRSWTTATTYTTTAAAATATTAGTESTNTVTITFGATPANCNTGNIITIAGATPSGYNGNWYILTRTATQITYFNGTTGLGAISVQGTGICPVQQDADVFANLGGSATTPNFPLQSCVYWMGQNVTLKNSNTTSPWTVTPFTASETIDGATSITMPTASSGNNPVVVLQPTLVSSAAAGCTWKRLQ